MRIADGASAGPRWWGGAQCVSMALGLVLLVATGANAQQSGLPALRVPDCLGVNIHFVGSEEKQVEQIAAAGFRFVRMDVIWSNVEIEKGKYHFEPYDELLAALEKHNIRPLFILCYANAHYDSGASPYTDEGRKAFAAFAGAAAARFKGRGVLWEIWNEPNISRFWSPQPSADDYVKLARDAYRALKAADPGSTVLAPALSGADHHFLEAAFRLGLLDTLDVVSLHPYGAPRPEDAIDHYSRVRELIRQYAPKDRAVPIVSGEWGYAAVGGCSVEKQAEYLARMFLANLMSGVSLSIWYDWRNDGLDAKEPEHNFGTVYNDFTPKPAYLAAKTLSTELAGYEFACRIAADSDSDYLLLFRKGDDFRMAAWTIGEAHKAKISIDVEAVEVVSLLGERKRLDVKDETLELELTEAVTYVEPLAKSRRWLLESSWRVTASTRRGESGIEALISSESSLGGDLSVSGEGVLPARMNVTGSSPGPSSLNLATRFVSTGKRRATVRVALAVEGLKSPLVRVVEIDTSACLVADVLPPAARELWFSVERPARNVDAPFKGAVHVGNTEGIRLDNDSCRVEIAEGSDRTTARIRMTQDPAAIYSFSYRLVDDRGNDLVRGRSRRYSVLESFADGKVGDEVREYQVALDGDSKVSAQAKLTYAASPPGAPEKTCARLDYKFGDGWRFVRLSPRPSLKIFESPTSVKMWVSGDGKEGLARLRLVDSDGQVFQPDLGRLDFTGWRCLEADLTGQKAGHWGGKNDGIMRYPISWDTIFLLDNAGGRKQEGSVLLGSIMVCYD